MRLDNSRGSVGSAYLWPSSQKSARNTFSSGFRQIGSGRSPRLGQVNELIVLSMFAKAGFREVSSGMLPDNALDELKKMVKSNEAVSYWMNPATGQVRVLVQDEDNREKLRILNWQNDRWNTML